MGSNSKGVNMDANNQSTPKPWYKSMTLWGAAITALSVFSPKYAAIVPAVVGDVGTIVGLVTTIIGRVRNPGGGVPQRTPLQ